MNAEVPRLLGFILSRVRGQSQKFCSVAKIVDAFSTKLLMHARDLRQGALIPLNHLKHMGRPSTRCGGCKSCHSKKACEVLRRQREGLEGGSPASPSESSMQEESAPEAAPGSTEEDVERAEIISQLAELLGKSEDEDVERAEISRQLAELLGKSEEELQRIRQTPDCKTSLIDTVAAMGGLDGHNAARTLRDVIATHPELGCKISQYRFPGPGRYSSPVADLATVYEILMVLPGRNAARTRSQAARLMVRYLGGDLTLIKLPESLQEKLASEVVISSSEEEAERAEVSRQLAELLGKSEEELQRIRQTPDCKTSLIDTVMTLSGLDACQCARTLRDLFDRFPELRCKISQYKFPGRGQRDTPVADLATVYEILMVLPGRNAARIRSQAARLMVRYLGGDLTLIQDVERLHHVQQRMAEEDPTNPHRVFGAAVEAEAAGVQENTRLPELEVIDLDVSFARVADKHLYAMTTEANYIQNLWKIGVASDVGQRERELQTGSCGGIRAFLVWPRMEQLESIVLRALPSPGASGGSEWRHCTVSDLKAKVDEALVELKRRLSLPPPVAVRTRPRQDDDEEQRRSVRRRREELELGEQEQVLAEKVQALLSVQTRQMLMHDLARQGNIEAIRIFLRREDDASTT